MKSFCPHHYPEEDIQGRSGELTNSQMIQLNHFVPSRVGTNLIIIVDAFMLQNSS